MLQMKTRKKICNALRASVKKEMAKPRMTKSARKGFLKLATARIPEHPSTIMSGTVKKIIPPLSASQPEKALVAVDAADQCYRNLRFENTLKDEYGEDVKLKKGAHVEVIITEEPDR
jgi:hypothetical protein